MWMLREFYGVIVSRNGSEYKSRFFRGSEEIPRTSLGKGLAKKLDVVVSESIKRMKKDPTLFIVRTRDTYQVHE
jgi:hypothetical protein